MPDLPGLRDQLADQRDRLEAAAARAGAAADLEGLIRCVDDAIARLDGATFGRCLACGETVEDDALLENPLLEYCLCRLTPEQQEDLQRDLDLATRTQAALLPKQDLTTGGWHAHYRYIPAGPVSGDYCDVVASKENGDPIFFMVGDVSGKGVAASFVMARLHALFRTLIDAGVSLKEMVVRANRLFGENNIPTQYATLVCGQARRDGRIAICNAGHPPPIMAGGGEVRSVEATGLPVGLFTTGPYSVFRTRLSAGDTLLLYSDGLTEARNGSGREFGSARLLEVVRAHHAESPGILAETCLDALRRFLSGARPSDDLTLMVVRRRTA